MTELIEFSLRILPGLVLLTAIWLCLRGPAVTWRMTLLMLGFILMRDTFTPLGFWTFGAEGPAIWLRFVEQPALLAVLGAMSILVVLLVQRAAPQLRELVDWGRPDLRTLLTGLAGATVVVAPFALAYQFVPLEARGGPVPPMLLAPLAFFAYAGNFLEEVLFRGYLQGHLGRTHGPLRTVLLSGLFFAAGHIFLASTVTAVGWPLLGFTLLEGLVCAEVARRRGVLAATVTHGTVIFVLASGLL